MEFTVKKGTFQKELGFVQGVIEKKTTIPVLQNILIKSDGDSGIEIVATDLDVSIRCKCEAQVSRPGQMLVHARKLFDVIRSLPEADVHFQKDDQSWAVVRCERSRFRVVGQPEENFPQIPNFKSGHISFSSRILRYFIEHTIFAITQEESQRYALNGAQFVLSKGRGRMIATDGHRLAYVEHSQVAQSTDEVKVLIPRKTLMELLKMASDSIDSQVFFERDENHIIFQIGDRVLLSRTLSGQFPNYELVMPKETSYSMVFKCEELAAGIRRAALMADEKSRVIKVRICDGRAEIRSHNSESGEAQELLDVDYNGPEISLGFNSQYLLDFMQCVGSEDIYFEFKDERSQAQLRPKGDSEYDYRYVVMPVRM